jgi:hypothetical protein
MSGINQDTEFQSPLTGSITAISQTIDITTTNQTTERLQISGTWSGTIVVEASNDLTTFYTLPLIRSSDEIIVTSIITNGIYTVNSNAYKLIRVRSSSWASGTATLTVWGSDNSTLNSNVSLLRGGSDGTVIGNTGDSLKTTATLSSSPTTPVHIEMPLTLIDAFSRLRVSSPYTLFDSTFTYDLQPDLYSTLVTNTGTVTWDTNKKAAVLTTSTTSGSSAIIQSRQYIRYQPGKSQLVLITGNFKSSATGVKKKFGQFDDNNGKFFMLDGTTLSVNLRSKISGSVVDTSVIQSNWNIDKLDGTGTSGITLNMNNQQIMFINYQWLGAGKIVFGFDIGGDLIPCHAMDHSNILTTLYSQTAILPIRSEIINSSTTSSTLEFTCASVISEGGIEAKGRLRTMNYAATAPKAFAASTTIPIISIRKQAAYLNVPVLVEEIGLFVNTADDFLVTIISNGTLTSPTWTDVAGFCQRDIASTAITGGITIYSTYVRSSSTSESKVITDLLSKTVNNYIGSDLSGNSEILSLVAYNITTSAAAYGFINYREIV